MLILLSCAKAMSDVPKAKTPLTTFPRFRREAAGVALQMSQFFVGELGRLLQANPKIVVKDYKRYQDFHSETTRGLPALLAYTGIVFKRLSPRDFSNEDFRYAQDHLRLTSFCYRLLHPLDMIRPYRLEGDVRLPEPGTQTMFEYWRPVLTDLFIEDTKKASGILCNLASDEMQGLSDWKRVEREVRVMTPKFHIWKNGKLTAVAVYTRMSKGEITRCIPKNRIESVGQLEAFAQEGFEFSKQLSDEKKYVFTSGKTE